MTATPTPGDLSARLLAYATRKAKARDALGVPAGDYVGQEEIDTLCQAAAALSALPAAGGEVVDCWLVRCRRTGRIFWSDPSRSTAEGYARQIAHRMPDNTLDTEVIPLYAQGAK